MKRLYIFVSILLVVFLSFPCLASSYSSYPGSLSSTYVEYLSEYVKDLDPDDDYVLFRSADYTYVFAYGKDLTYSGKHLKGSCSVITLTQIRDSGYNYDWSVQLSTDSNFDYAYDNDMVYSNVIPGSPSLSGQSDSQFSYISLVMLILIFLAVMFLLFKKRTGAPSIK